MKFSFYRCSDVPEWSDSAQQRADAIFQGQNICECEERLYPLIETRLKILGIHRQRPISLFRDRDEEESPLFNASRRRALLKHFLFHPPIKYINILFFKCISWNIFSDLCGEYPHRRQSLLSCEGSLLAADNKGLSGKVSRRNATARFRYWYANSFITTDRSCQLKELEYLL